MQLLVEGIGFLDMKDNKMELEEIYQYENEKM